MKKREAIILAGGFGTRLSHLLKDVPKPMADVAGRPFLRFLLDDLAKNGFRHVVIADGYLKEVIEDYFGDSYRGIAISYSQESKPLLTGGAVKKALELCTEEWVYILNGDTYLDVNYDDFDRSLSKDDAFVAYVAITKMLDFDRYGSVSFTNNEISSFNEKAYCSEGFINAGVYFVKADSFRAFPTAFSLETEFFKKKCKKGLIGCVQVDGLFIDIGVPKDYERAQTLLAPLKESIRLAFFDRDGTINEDTGHLFEPNKIALIKKTVNIICKYNKLPEYRVVVVTNQAGIAKGLYTVDDMNALHDALDADLKKYGAHIDAYYYCPHHPAYTGECACRKPRPGMLQKAMFDFESEPSDCVMFGDKESDRLAASACSVSFVSVEDL